VYQSACRINLTLGGDFMMMFFNIDAGPRPFSGSFGADVMHLTVGGQGK